MDQAAGVLFIFIGPFHDYFKRPDVQSHDIVEGPVIPLGLADLAPLGEIHLTADPDWLLVLRLIPAEDPQ